GRCAAEQHVTIGAARNRTRRSRRAPAPPRGVGSAAAIAASFRHADLYARPLRVRLLPLAEQQQRRGEHERGDEKSKGSFHGYWVPLEDGSVPVASTAKTSSFGANGVGWLPGPALPPGAAWPTPPINATYCLPSTRYVMGGPMPLRMPVSMSASFSPLSAVYAIRWPLLST